ncbi:MAG: GNAT family N-acetyltransferase [Lachnospiraceae bacterium]
MEIRKGTEKDVEEVGRLYANLCDYLEQNMNYCGWKKDIYPTEEDALWGVKEDSLYTAVEQKQIIGTVILNHHQDKAYERVKWQTEVSAEEIMVIHTLAAHPDYLRCGVGKKLMNFALKQAFLSKMKAVRLDVYEKNIPAIHLYESLGFKFIGKADLGYGDRGLKWFRLYEKKIAN